MRSYLDGLLVNDKAHDLLVELFNVVKDIPAEHTDDYQDLGDRITSYLGEDK